MFDNEAWNTHSWLALPAFTNDVGDATGSLPLKAYTREIPPGWRPRSYPLREYFDNLAFWVRFEKVPEGDKGPAILSRLVGGAHKQALKLEITRGPYDANGIGTVYRGLNAICLPRIPSILDPNTGLWTEECLPGYMYLEDILKDRYFLDDQDLAWTSLDKFFMIRRTREMDIQTYYADFEKLLEEATTNSGLQLNIIGKCWLFFAKAGLQDKFMQDLRFKFDGDMNRFEEMVKFCIKIAKNDDTVSDQATGYKLNPSVMYAEVQQDGWYDFNV